jgi:4-carboxymuconolactone decarboxylase
MTRIPRATRETIAPEHQAIWDRLGAVRSPQLPGPYGILMHLPQLAERVGAVEDYFRFDAALSAADRELVVLTAAREMGARYAWARHEARAREVGVRPETIEILRAQGSLDGLTPRERLVVEVARALLRTRGIPDDLFGRALAELGQRQLIEAVVLLGHYGIVGLVLNAFDVPPPEDTPTF